jgi:hypothetical protein
MPSRTLTLLLLGAVACDPNVVDVVREPAPIVEPPDMEPPPPMSPLQTSLLHRYSFDGEGTEAVDSRFQAHGVIVGSKLSNTGTLPLAGAKSLQYVDLPDQLVSSLTDATFEAWLTWNGGVVWQRIFDFGSSEGGEDPYPPAKAQPGEPVIFGGKTYLFLTPNAGVDTSRPHPAGMRVAYSLDGVTNEQVCYASDKPFPKGGEHHVAVVVDAAAETMALYLNGALVNRCSLTHPLSSIDDVNNWLGRSNYTDDAELDGEYSEFRIYGAALSDAEIADSFKAGPDAKP